MTDNAQTSTFDHESDPAEIESEIRKTQDQMSRTVERIGDQLSPRNVINALLDKAEDNNIDARYLIDGARRNPLALGMIAGGLIWLVSDQDAKFPKMGKASSQRTDHHDPSHRDYVSHMERVERMAGEDDGAYYQRRDTARANYFMLERGHEEDETSFKQRLNDVGDSFREKRRGWMDATDHAATAMRDRGNDAMLQAGKIGTSITESAKSGVSRATDAYARNPLIGGLIAAAAGAIAGSTLPLSQVEDNTLADLGESARDVIGEQKDKLVSTARDKKDELLDMIDQDPKPAAELAQDGAGGERALENNLT